MLEEGDVFMVCGMSYWVYRIENGVIYYGSLEARLSGSRGRLNEMGANSQEKLILITNKTKQNEHQN